MTVIGKGGRNIAKEDAPAAVFGYCCGRRQETPEEHVAAVVELFLRAYARR